MDPRAVSLVCGRGLGRTGRPSCGEQISHGFSAAPHVVLDGPMPFTRRDVGTGGCPKSRHFAPHSDGSGGDSVLVAAQVLPCSAA